MNPYIYNPNITNGMHQQQPMIGSMEFPGNPCATITGNFGNYSVQEGNGQPMAYPNPCATYNPHLEFPGTFNPYNTNYNPQMSVVPCANVPYGPFAVAYDSHMPMNPMPVQPNGFGAYPYNSQYNPAMYQNNPFAAPAYSNHFEPNYMPFAPMTTVITSEVSDVEPQPEESSTLKEFTDYENELKSSLTVCKGTVTEITKKIEIMADSIQITQNANYELEAATKLSTLHADLDIAKRAVEELENQISANDVARLTFELNRI